MRIKNQNQAIEYLIKNPDYSDRKGKFIWVSDNELDAYYWGLNVVILARKINGKLQVERRECNMRRKDLI